MGFFLSARQGLPTSLHLPHNAAGCSLQGRPQAAGVHEKQRQGRKEPSATAAQELQVTLRSRPACGKAGREAAAAAPAKGASPGAFRRCRYASVPAARAGALAARQQIPRTEAVAGQAIAALLGQRA